MNRRESGGGLPQRRRGFSLLELLVAMAVTALIALMAWRFIDSATAAAEHGQALLEPVETLERFWQVLEQDLQHSVATAPAQQPELLPGSSFPFSAGAQLQSSRDLALRGIPLLQLTRDAWTNPLQQRRSELQRVLYAVADGALVRQAWPERNQPVDPGAAQTRIVLDGVESISLRLLPLQARDLAQDWVDTWPLPQAGASDLPLAVSVSLTLDWLGPVERWFLLPGA